ncbi:MAG: hypothetical protein WCH98_14840 [Verrucomicrobiota bacterium]
MKNRNKRLLRNPACRPLASAALTFLPSRDEESFEFVGFSTNFGTEAEPVMGTIKSLTLTKGR